MSFSAVTCLSYTGTTPLGGVLNLYSDTDSFSTAFQTNINLSAITGNECPYYISNVPNGTTQIRIFDNLTGCYCDIPIQSNNLCTNCDLDFNLYSGSTIGRLFAGNLTGSCEANITDYRIYWYETGNTVTPAYISGYGTGFTPYSFTHPLTGTSAIFAQSGTYVPVIDKIKISGLTFSQTGGTGNIPAELSCFSSSTVTVNPFTCDNGDGSSDDSNYEHRVNFLSAAAGVTPTTLDSTFLLTGSTNYFAWKFKGFDVEDRLRLIYYGSAYSEPLLIEDIVVGTNLTASDFSLSNVPKSAGTVQNSYYIKKVTCLTGITKNVNDTIRIEVIPNSANTQTNWDFYFTCLNTFSQNTCILNNFPYKIKSSTITSVTGSCNSNTIIVELSGCSKNTDDFSKYLVNDVSASILNFTIYSDSITYASPPSVLQRYNNLYFNSIQFSTGNFYYQPLVCATPSVNTITYKKYISGGTIGTIDMEFNSINDFNTYYDSFKLISTGTSSYAGTICDTSSGSWSGTPFTPTDIRYYRYYQLGIPSNTGTTNCGDGTTIYYYHIHPSTQITTGTTGPNYTLRFTMPTIINGLTYDPSCSVSSQIQSQFVNIINDSSTGTTNNFTGTTTTGSKYTYPFNNGYFACSGVTSLTATTMIGEVYYPKYLNETIVYTGTTPTIVPSLSGKTFNFNPSDFTLVNDGVTNLGSYGRYNYCYTIELNNPSDFRDYKIYAKQITGTTIGSQTLIYGFTGSTNTSTIYDYNYFY